MYKPSGISCNFWFYSYSSLQVMDSSQHLPPPVLVIPSPSDVMLLETEMGTPAGKWVGAVSVSWVIAHQMTLVLVGLAVLSQLQLGLGLEQMLLHSHQH